MKTPSRRSGKRTAARLTVGAAVAALAIGVIATSGPATAVQPPPPAADANADAAPAGDNPGTEPAPEFDDAQIRLGLRIWKEKINCGTCHGWNGAGVPDDPRSPAGADLRETLLNPEQLAEVIRCGRIGTDMPAYDSRAYIDDRCYGVTEEQLGEQTPQKRGTYLIGREVDGLVAYIFTTMVGAGESTLEQCEEYWTAGAPICEVYQPAD